ncbi:MAG: dioxygenase [Micromonosporaceae bacterium]|nr:dioxygenase [Micromonosporaceae bacterium]
MTYPLDDFLAAALPASREQRAWTPADGPMPALYLGHGAPPLLDDSLWMEQLLTWSQSLPKPKSILIVSAHWEHAPLSISATSANTPLVYDFGGFERRFYELTYPTPDAGALGHQVTALMPDTDDVHEHRTRGLDHGAWVPLMVMYPHGDVPVLQLSLPTQDPHRLIDLGRRLRPLREEGVLVIGSGFLTHGLPFLTREHMLGLTPTPPGWSVEFDLWAGEALDRGDVEALANYGQAPGMPYAHPTVEHYTPLFVTLGSADDPETPPATTIEGFAMGLSKRSIQVA